MGLSPNLAQRREDHLLDHISERLAAEQISALMRQFPGVMVANFCNAGIFVVANWGKSDLPRALGWASIVWSIVSLMVMRQWRRRSSLRRSVSRRRRGVKHLLLYAVALGLAWAALPLLFFADASPGSKLLIACLSSGMLGGGVFVLASVPAAAIAFSGPIALGALVVLLRVGDAEHALMAFMLAGYSAVLFAGSFNHAKELRNLITTQIAAEQKANTSARNLGAMAEMTAGLAHEISQPLSAATAYIEAAERLTKLPADERPIPVERPLRNAATQLENVRQIITHLRHAISEHETEKAPLSLHAVIERVLDASRRGQEHARLRIETNLVANNDLVLANDVQMRQLFTNLIANAIDAMESSSDRSLVISSHAVDGNRIRIDVADTGEGISTAIREKIFDPLISTKGRGLGVGLSITRTIVEEHRGQIWAEPNPGGGTIFSLVLPLQTPAG